MQKLLVNRNTVEYDCAGSATSKDAEELIEFTRKLREAVLAWRQRDYIVILGPAEQVSKRSVGPTHRLGLFNPASAGSA